MPHKVVDQVHPQKKAKHARKRRNGIGGMVRRLRDHHNWSQTDLARACQLIGWDVGRDIIAKIEGLEREVTDLELPYIAKVFSISLSQLMGETPLPPVLHRKTGKEV